MAELAWSKSSALSENIQNFMVGYCNLELLEVQDIDVKPNDACVMPLAR